MIPCEHFLNKYDNHDDDNNNNNPHRFSKTSTY